MTLVHKKYVDKEPIKVSWRKNKELQFLLKFDISLLLSCCKKDTHRTSYNLMSSQLSFHEHALKSSAVLAFLLRQWRTGVAAVLLQGDPACNHGTTNVLCVSGYIKWAR